MVDFRINVIVDPRKAQAGTKRVQQSLQQTQATAQQLRATLVRTFGLIGGGAILTSSIRLIADFSQEISTLGAVSGATEQQLEALREETKRLGATTRFSATEAAAGATFLARAGFNAEQILSSLGGTLQLAQAGGLDLARAADIASNVLKGFQLDVDQTGRVVDVLALAANSANTNVQQLGDAFRKAAPIAAGLGVEIETTAAAIAALSDAGIQGESAGAGLLQLISRLQNPAKDLQQELARVGLTIDDVSVSTQGLVGALANAARAVSAEDALRIFDIRGGPAFQVLREAIPDIQRFEAILNNAGGTAERVARIQDDNLKGSLLALRSAFQGLILEIGDAGATGALRGFVDALTRGLRVAIENIDQVINGLEAVITLIGIGLARRAIPAAIRAVNAFTLALIRNPLGLVATALSTVIALLVGFGDQLQISADSAATFADVAAVAFDRLRGALQSVVAFFSDGVLGAAISQSLGDLDFSFRGILITIGALTDNIIGLFRGTFDAVLAIWENFPDRFSAFGELALFGLRESAEATLDFILGILQTIGDVILRVGGRVRDLVASLSASVRAALSGNVREAELLQQAVQNNANLVVQSLKGIPDQIRDNVAALREVELLPTVELSEQAVVTGEAVGKAFVDGFTGTTTASDFVAQVLADAEERAGQRRVQRFAEQFDPDAGIVPAAETVNASASALDSYANSVNKVAEETKKLSDEQQVFQNALFSAEDALANFVTTGEVNFGQFVNSILSDLTRLLARQGLQSLVTALSPGGAGAAFLGDLFGGFRQAGGPVNPNQAFLVGEKGPELFKPPSAGTVVPADQTAAMLSPAAAPAVNVRVVNVSDPREALDAMDSAAGDQIILNALARKRRSAKELLA